MFQNEEKISGHQGLMLILAAGIGNIFIVITVPAVREAGRDGWIAVFLAYMLAAVTGMLLINLSQRFPDKTFVQYLPQVLGKIPGKIAGLSYIVGWFVMSALIFRETGELMKLFLPNTPLIAINLLMSVLVVYAMRKGFEVFARTTELFAPMIVLIILATFILIAKSVDFANIKPMLEIGFMPVALSLKALYPYGMETVLFMSLWLPCLNRRKEAQRALMIGMPLTAALLSMQTLICIGFLGLGFTEMTIFPVIRIYRSIVIEDFLSGFDVLFMLVWIVASFLELMVFLYQPIVGLAQWLNLNSYKPLILPMVIGSNLLSLLPSDVVQVLRLDTLKNLVILLPLSFLVLITWLLAVIRKSEEKPQGKPIKNKQKTE